MTRISTASLSLLIGVLGCGGSSSHPSGTLVGLAPVAAPSPFPSADELAQLAAAAAPTLTASAVDVATWELAGPFPERIEPVAATELAPWSGLFADAVQRGVLTMTADLQCVARELGRFYLEHHAQPADSLRRHVEGWCGTAAAGVEVLFIWGDVPAEVTDDALFTGWQQDAIALVDRATAAGNALAGVWFGRDDGRAVLAVARAVPRLALEPTALVPPADGVIVLRGTLAEPAERLRVLVNRGALGVGACTLDLAIALPAFEARCAVDSADATAWIEVSAVPPGRLLGKVVLRVLARRADASRSYALALAQQPGDPAGAAVDTVTLAHRVNRARELAGLSPLALADTESAVATALAPHFFAATLTGDPTRLTDRIALGLMAGWEVPAMVSDAGFYSSWGTAVSADHLIATALDSPLGRSALLDPLATHLAVGGLHDGGSGVTGGLFLTYQTLAGDPAAATRTVVEAITAARLERGLPAPRLLDDTEDRAATVTARLRRGELSPADAMSSLLAYASRISGTSTRGWVIDAREPGALELPDDVVAAVAGAALIVAAPHRPAGEPWWRWAVLVIAPQP